MATKRLKKKASQLLGNRKSVKKKSATRLVSKKAKKSKNAYKPPPLPGQKKLRKKDTVSKKAKAKKARKRLGGKRATSGSGVIKKQRSGVRSGEQRASTLWEAHYYSTAAVSTRRYSQLTLLCAPTSSACPLKAR